MAIPYQTAKFKFAIAILGSTAKFNSRQYFQLYGTHAHTIIHSLSLSLCLCWSGSQEVMHMNSGQEPADFESSNAVEDQLNLDAPDSSM